jgi:hypothetical protein
MTAAVAATGNPNASLGLYPGSDERKPWMAPRKARLYAWLAMIPSHPNMTA